MGLRLECTLCHALRLMILATAVVSVMPTAAWAQGETTSAIIGQVTDATGAVVPDATVTVTNKETGLRRAAKTEDRAAGGKGPLARLPEPCFRCYYC